MRNLRLLYLVILLGCGYDEGLEIHLIPDGYEGPVVVVFDDPKGKFLEQNEKGAFVYKIPPSGELRVKGPRPGPEIHALRFFYDKAGGPPQRIPSHGKNTDIQVFAEWFGNYTNVQEGKAAVYYTSYIVGIPNKRDDWISLRRQAIDKAIGRPPLGGM